MKILAIDTSTARMVVAFVNGDTEREMSKGELAGSQTHGEHLAELVREVLQGELPDLIAVGIGPGPYTGLRVGIVTAEVLAHSWGVPVVGVPTLAAIAHGYRRAGGGECAAVLDVKRREIAWQVFGADGHQLSEATLSHIEDLTELLKYSIVGPAFETQKLVEPQVAAVIPVSAISIALLARDGKTSAVQPLYLRDPDAAAPKPNKSVLGNG
jgi:tRNA threonylcarbamoyl adenosine modification protein YeaZ